MLKPALLFTNEITRNTVYMEDTFDYCTECGQALDWTN